MFRKVLIANRGEIACRIARTARAMGIATVAVYSDADENALHVSSADEAFRIGSAPARESYLSIERILEAARRTEANAIHPGYGFLSENAEFAERCVDAGITFIGPPAHAMRLMGSKAQAKELMAQIGTPVLPGYHSEAQDTATLTQAAKRIGFPVLIKASAGGGGRGMRVVSEPHELQGALESARREALGAFGDDRLLIEKFLDRPRHVEVQIFADSLGNVVAFPERDCSLQRRRQKIIEETPASALDPELRSAMRTAAKKAALASGYAGAGTVEFLVQDNAFYFLEMNTRLQVEHPVTEMISGLDLVDWQFRVAAGEPLPLAQEEIETRGAAIEARICAENPAEGFIPATGRIAHLRWPQQSTHLRIDSGVAEGDPISSYYDSLLAKLIVWGADREEAVSRLRTALESCEFIGFATNLDFLCALVGDTCFAAGEYDTGFVDAFNYSARAVAPEDDSWLLAAAAAGWFRDAVQNLGGGAGSCGGPWKVADGWRLFGKASCAISFLFEGRTLSARLRPVAQDAFQLETPSETADVRVSANGGKTLLFVNGVGRQVAIIPAEKGYTVVRAGKNYDLERLDPLMPRTPSLAREEILTAPLPARVVRTFVQPGDRVLKGEHLLVLEAMKMEITITAPRDGDVEIVSCAEGEAVREGAVLLRLAEAS